MDPESPKDSIFSRKRWMNCGGELLSMDVPLVMGILNTTPDSFYDGGKFAGEEACLKQTEKMLKEGADFIDIGGYSSRPGAADVDEETEKKRVLPVIDLLVSHFPGIRISIDTFRSKVAMEAVEHGAQLINDISAGELDKEMFSVVAGLQVPYILMHMQGRPETMQVAPAYGEVVSDLLWYFSEKTNRLRCMGVNDLVIDPGFGFGKSLEDNYHLLQGLEQFQLFDFPLLVGVSRKSMINKVIATSPERALNGTTVVHTLALMKGASILRAHDVKEAKEAIKIVNYLQKN